MSKVFIFNNKEENSFTVQIISNGEIIFENNYQPEELPLLDEYIDEYREAIEKGLNFKLVLNMPEAISYFTQVQKEA